MTFLGKFLFRIFRLARLALPIRYRPRVRVILRNDNDEILLIRTWLSRQNWSLPGGGIASGEKPIEAIRRETLEETGIDLSVSRFSDVGQIQDDEINLTYVIYLAEVAGQPLPPLTFPYTQEVIERKWWPIKHLPEDISRYTKRAITLVVDNKI